MDVEVAIVVDVGEESAHRVLRRRPPVGGVDKAPADIAIEQDVLPAGHAGDDEVWPTVGIDVAVPPLARPPSATPQSRAASCSRISASVGEGRAAHRTATTCRHNRAGVPIRDLIGSTFLRGTLRSQRTHRQQHWILQGVRQSGVIRYRGAVDSIPEMPLLIRIHAAEARLYTAVRVLSVGCVQREKGFPWENASRAMSRPR